MRIFENAAKHPIITISTLVGLNLLAVLILLCLFPLGRMMNGEHIQEDSSPDFVPERYDHSGTAERSQDRLTAKIESSGLKDLTVEFISLYDKLGDAYLSESSYDKAIANYEIALSLREKLKVPDDDERARTLIGLAASQEYLYHYDLAEKAATKALKVREKLFGEESIQAYVVWMRLAEIRRWAGKTSESIDACKRAQDIAAALGEQSHERLALERKAEYLEDVDRLEEAEQAAKENLQLSDTDKDPQAKMKTLSSLAAIQSTLKKYKEAETNFTEALKLFDEAYDQDILIDSIDAYTIFLWDRNQKKEAMKNLEIYSEKLVQKFNGAPEQQSSALENLHTRLYHCTQTELGVYTAEKYYDLCKKDFGERSDEAIRAMAVLATACAKTDQKRFKENIEAAIKIANEVLPERAWTRLDLHERYGDELAAQENYKRAAEEYMLAFKEVEANDHEVAARLLSERASMLESAGMHIEARDGYKSAITEAEKLATKETENYLLNLALIEMDSFHNYKEAAQLLEESIKKSEQHLGQGCSLEVAKPLIECYEKLGKAEQVAAVKKRLKDTYLKALNMDEKKFGAENVRVINALEVCGDAYFAVGEFREAEQYYLRSKQLLEKVDSKADYAQQHRSNCKLLMAMCQAELNKNDEAAKNFKEAFAFFDANKDEALDTEAVVALSSYSNVLKKLHRNAEASAIDKRIAALPSK